MDIRSLLVVCLLGCAWIGTSSAQRPGKRPRQKFNNKKFMRKVENRIRYGRPVFSPQAMGMMKRGWGKENIYNKVNKAFGNCDVPDQDVVKNMFPGLFQSVEDINRLPEMQVNQSPGKVAPDPPQTIRNWKAVAARKIRIPRVVSTSSDIQIQTNQSQPAVQGSFSRTAFICDCCKVDRFFESYENVTVGENTYDVIQLPDLRQFFAIERCPDKPLCAFGGCIQRYTRQPILIWNDTKPYHPPLDFAQFEFPTHCEWANIGQ